MEGKPHIKQHEGSHSKAVSTFNVSFFSMPTLLHLNVIQSLSGSISNNDDDDDDDVNDDFDDNTAGSGIFVYSNC